MRGRRMTALWAALVIAAVALIVAGPWLSSAPPVQRVRVAACLIVQRSPVVSVVALDV